MRPGFFCVLEGIDGSGKSTLIQAIRDHILETGLEECFGPAFTSFGILSEPTQGPTGRRIREHLKRQDDLSRQDWLDLFYTDRYVNVEQNIQPGLAKGELLFQDRYFYSTAAYQGDPGKSPRCKDIVRASEKAGFPQPDLIVYMDIAPEVALERIQKSRRAQESFETLAELSRIHRNYQQILDERFLPLDGAILKSDAILRLNAERDRKELLEAVFARIYKFLVIRGNH
ncbi:MAG: dTMP kinase [Leptospiraceae bacterium]|nr:dTMP kinase [Leptospiraceae bacterium]